MTAASGFCNGKHQFINGHVTALATTGKARIARSSGLPHLLLLRALGVGHVAAD